MPAVVPVVLSNHAPSSPVTYTVHPAGQPKDDGVWEWQGDNSIPAQRVRLTSKVNRITPGKRMKSEVRVVLPIVETQVINGVSQQVVVDYNYATVSMDMSAKATNASRGETAAYAASAVLPGSVVYTSVVQGNWIY